MAIAPVPIACSVFGPGIDSLEQPIDMSASRGTAAIVGNRLTILLSHLLPAYCSSLADRPAEHSGYIRRSGQVIGTLPLLIRAGDRGKVFVPRISAGVGGSSDSVRLFAAWVRG